MATKKEVPTRRQKLYIRHISLFGRAVPLTIKAAIGKLVQNKEQTLTDKKEHIRTCNNDLYKVLFADSEESIEQQLTSFKITALCELFYVLGEQPNVDNIKRILNQRRDIEKYEKFASLDDETIDNMYTSLKQSLLELSKDTDVLDKCKRLIYSSDVSTDIQLNIEVFESLNLTDDVDSYIGISTSYDQNLNADDKMEEDSKTSNEGTKDDDEEVRTVQFVQQLSDKILRAGDSSALVCELKKDNCHVVWSKNGNILEETKTVYIYANKGRHCLIFSRAIREESGTYKCTYNDLSTSASVIISKDSGVCIEIPLHNEHDGDIREYMKVALSCTINLTGKTPRWFHNNKEIEASNAKVTIVSTDNEHKLIIDYVESSDNGEYMVVFAGVTSKTSITIKGHSNLTIIHQIQKDNYKNWMKGVLALKYLKEGLEKPATNAVEIHHEQILKDLSEALSNENCSECNAKNLLPFHLKNQCPITQKKNECPCSKSPNKRRLCPRKKLCSKIYDMIVRDHRFKNPSLRNTKMGKWKTNAWSVAACYLSGTEFIHTSTYKEKKSSKEMDCAELLSLFVNNIKYLRNTNYGAFEMARRHRNELLHNPNYEISIDKLNEYLRDFRDVLEVKNSSNIMVFDSHPEVKQSLKDLDELQHLDIHICTQEKLEEIKKEVKRTAMIEAADKLEEAINQKDQELAQMQQKLQKQMCEMHDGTEISWFCEDHHKLICLSCKEKKHRPISTVGPIRECSRLRKLENKDSKGISSVLYKKFYKVNGTVIIICSIPRNEFLALIKESDTGNSVYELCKLNICYSPITYCSIKHDCLIDMCYIGNNKVVAANGSNLVFFDIASPQILHEKREIKCHAKCLACHGDTIYTFDGRNILTYSTNGEHMGTLCTLYDKKTDSDSEKVQSRITYCKIAISSDGESISCMQSDIGMIQLNSRNGDVEATIDLTTPRFLQQQKNLLTGLPLCMIYTGDRKVIIFESEGLVLVVENGSLSGQTKILSIKAKTVSAFSMLYDITTSNLIVGDEDRMHIFDVRDKRIFSS